MTDNYLNLVNSGPAGKLAKKLGLPRPAVLRRHKQGAPLVPGPLLVLGAGAAADSLASELLGWNQDVRRHAAPGEKLGAVVVVLENVTAPGDLGAPILELGQAVHQLARGGRIVTVSRPAKETTDPAEAAARQGIDGIVRSVGRELRAGATANGILLRDGASVQAAAGALRFLLSGKSAFVSGQFITVRDSGQASGQDEDRPLAGQTAVVTGAARGIGAEIAAVLSRDGAQVVLVDVPAAGEQLAAVANRIGGTALQLDITTADAAARILEHVQQRYGSLDLLVHNAGITRDKLLANMDTARWDSVLAVNLESQLRINETLLGSEVFAATGRIVCLASTSGIAGNRGQSNYAASKAGVIGMVRSTGVALDGTDRTINAVAPGFIETEMTAKMPFATREAARRLSSLQQGGLPIDVAETIAFLASPAAAGVNGEVLRVCGQSLVGA
ncbi:3-oxoacyl-ACP reductase [Arthrobacter sp. CAL618]|uniref:3-oxoacyl-ACP reductase n=1 Tax=Arthrobacter sp. CAL618 TaxID=1055770 RepID=UPI0003FB6D21|nr:3-oxoacyl-ACP reductase [Arthrobacter sp. CAL618]